MYIQYKYKEVIPALSSQRLLKMLKHVTRRSFFFSFWIKSYYKSCALSFSYIDGCYQEKNNNISRIMPPVSNHYKKL